MGRLRDVFLEVDAIEPDNFAWVHDLVLDILGVILGVEGDSATETEWKVHLGGLVVFWHVGVEVIFAIPLGDGRGATIEHEASEEGLLDGGLIENRQSPREAEAGGADIGIGFVAEGGGTGAEHFGVRFDLTVNFKSDGGNILHRVALF